MHIQACVCVHEYVCARVCVRVCACASVCACVRVCVRVVLHALPIFITPDLMSGTLGSKAGLYLL